MRERPILFSGPIVRALLDGRKTQTRRVVKPQPPAGCEYTGCDSGRFALCFAEGTGGSGNPVCVPPRPNHQTHQLACPFGVPGDRLWVRETWQRIGGVEGTPEHTVYRANGGDFSDYSTEDGDPFRWRPSIHMPRAASRITLEITDVRVERLQAISEEDARAEGVSIHRDDDCWSGTYRLAFELLWGLLNGFDGEPKARAP